MRNYIYTFLILLSFGLVSCGGGASYVVTIEQPNMDDKAIGSVLDIKVSFDEMDGNDIENISVTIKTKDEGLLLYTIPESLQNLNVGSHYDHVAEFTLDVQPGAELVLEATAFQEGDAENDKGRDMVSFKVN